jgi:Raf kinase inhibitor-like YbhB/YbcL family protein
VGEGAERTLRIAGESLERKSRGGKAMHHRVSTHVLLAVALAGLGMLSGCTPGGDGDTTTVSLPEVSSTVNWSLSSPAFSAGERVPVQYTGDGENLSPPLLWAEPPEGTVELVLICDDPDAPAGTFTHWLAWGLSPDLRELPAGIPTTATVADPAMVQGTNSANRLGYTGPKPPPGPTHRYQFYLYALTEKADLAPGADKAAVAAEVEAKAQASVMLEGVYSR